MTIEKLQANPSDPPLNGLRAFEVSGRYLSFRAASEELAVTQGAVAQQVRALEAHLGLRLFERLPRGLAFTATGRSYHEEISAGFAQLRRATAAIRPATDSVTISVTPTFAAKWLLPNLPDLTRAHPGIDLRVLATDSRLSFHADGIDLAVRQGGGRFGAGVEARLLFRQEVIAVAAPSQAPPGGQADAAALARMTLLRDTHNLWPDFFRRVLGAEPPAGRGFSFSQTALGIDAALAGQGVALASRFMVEEDLRAGRLTQIVPGALQGRGDFHLLALRGRRREAVRQVIDWLTARAGA